VPVFIYIALLLAYYNRTRPTKSRLWSSLVVFNHYILLALSLVLLSLALDCITSPAIQSYTLHDRWTKLFQTKNAQAMRRIQDAMDCCGFRSSRDMAWPFEDKDHGARACEVEFGRMKGCETGWAGKERAMMVAMVVIGGFGVICDVMSSLAKFFFGNNIYASSQNVTCLNE
jgi:hypothetical protein